MDFINDVVLPTAGATAGWFAGGPAGAAVGFGMGMSLVVIVTGKQIGRAHV